MYGTGECSDEFIYSTSTASVSLARMGVLIGIGTLIYKNTFEGVEALIRKGGAYSRQGAYLGR